MQTSILSHICADGRMITDLNSGEILCSACGQVSSERAIEGRAEWRNFESDNNNRQRTGTPNSLAVHDMGLSTIIGRANKDSAGHRLDPSVASTIQRLRTWDARSQVHSASDKNLLHAFYELGKLKDKLGLSDVVVEKAAYIYRKVQEKKLSRGRSISSMLLAATYIACRELGSQRSLRELTEITGIKRKALARAYRLVILELDVKVPLVDPVKCITTLANKTGISEKTKRIAVEMMKEVIQKEISAGKNPIGLAATVLYRAGVINNEGRTQAEIANAAGVTEVTLRNRFRDLKDNIRLN